MNVRRPPGVVVVAPGVLPRADGHETVIPLSVGERAAGAGKVRIERRIVLVGTVRVAARSVRLPDLDQGMRNRLAVLIEHAAGDDDALADRRALVLARQVMVAVFYIFVA